VTALGKEITTDIVTEGMSQVTMIGVIVVTDMLKITIEEFPTEVVMTCIMMIAEALETVVPVVVNHILEQMIGMEEVMDILAGEMSMPDILDLGLVLVHDLVLVLVPDRTEEIVIPPMVTVVESSLFLGHSILLSMNH